MTAAGAVPGWDDLVAAAVLGTGRRPFAGLGAAGPLAALAGATGDTAGLAGAAAAVWAWRQAGWTPAAAEEREAVEPAPDDPRPLLAGGPVRTLKALLEDPALRPVLAEWLRLAATDGRRLPAEWLPDLLDACPPSARADLDAAAGPRAGWLAALHPAWSGPGPDAEAERTARAVLAGGPERWDPGPASDRQRIAAFAAVRAGDAGLGRRLAERIWGEEPGATRAAIVACFGEGLGMADEPFLEDRLDDRRRDVRAAAAGLLARLPASRLARRTAARTLPLVGATGGPERALQVDRPGPPDAAARRDGIGADLAAMVAATPLAAWGPALGAGPAPADLLRWAARSGPAAQPLVDGWSAAAAATGDREWAAALLDHGAAPAAGLVRLVPAGAADRAIVGWLARTPLPTAVTVLSELPAPWSAPVSRAVLDALAGLVRGGDISAAGPVRDRLAMISLAVDPGVAPAAAALASADGMAAGARGQARLFWARALTQMAVTVHFRQAMYQEFA